MTTLHVSSGTLIVEMDGPLAQPVVGGFSTAPTPISRDGSVTVALIDTRSSTALGRYVELPTGAQVGDLVEAYYSVPDGTANYGSPLAVPPSGEGFHHYNVSSVPCDSASFRKLSTSIWGYGA